MKSIIIAIAFLAATVTAADVCTIECDSTTWTGNTSLAVDVGQNVEILFDITFQVFVVVNYKQNLVIATNGKFLVVVNINTGGYLLIDLKTQFAVYGKIDITFKNSNGTVDRTKLVVQLNVLLTKYDSITISTSGSFNFGLIITAFYRLEFDLSVILSGSAELVANLKASFTVWFELIQKGIVSGGCSLSNGIWGFIIVIIDIKIEFAVAIINVVRYSFEYFNTLRVEIIIELVKIIKVNIQQIVWFSAKFVAYITTSATVSIQGLLSYITNVSNNPVDIHVSFGGATLLITVIKIEGVYVLRFAFYSSLTKQNVDIAIILTNGVLFIHNLSTNVVVALYQRSIVIVNATSEAVIVGSYTLLGGLKGTVTVDAELSLNIRQQLWAKAAARVIAVITASQSKVSFSFAALYVAIVTKGSVSAVAGVVGTTYGSAVFAGYAGFFAQTSASGSFGGVAVGVFGDYSSVVSVAFSTVINVFGTTTGDWTSLVIKLTGGGSYSYSTSYTRLING